MTMMTNGKNQGVKRGLIIVVSEYDNFENLDFCKHDGEAIYGTLKSIGYEIPDRYKLIGKVEYSKVRDAIIEFFTDETLNANDILLSYISGYGLLANKADDLYLSSSEIHPKVPRLRGFSFDELVMTMQECRSRKIFTILNCFCDNTTSVTNGNTTNGAALGQRIIENKSTIKNVFLRRVDHCRMYLFSKHTIIALSHFS